jgi:hypothetical protein
MLPGALWLSASVGLEARDSAALAEASGMGIDGADGAPASEGWAEGEEGSEE